MTYEEKLESNIRFAEAILSTIETIEDAEHLEQIRELCDECDGEWDKDKIEIGDRVAVLSGDPDGRDFLVAPVRQIESWAQQDASSSELEKLWDEILSDD